MRKHFLTVAALCGWLAFCAEAQVTDPQLNRWLLQNPTAAERGEVLLNLEKQQISELGRCSVSPYAAPKLSQLPPSLQHLQYFFEGQNELSDLADRNLTQLPPEEAAALRKRYQTLYDQYDSRYQDEAAYYLGYVAYADGNYDEALRYFDRLPMENKFQETVPYYRMQILFAQGRWQEAVQAIETYTPRDHAFQLEAWRIKAECQMQLGDLEGARATYATYLNEADEPLAASAYNAGILEYDAENYAQAAKNAGIATKTNHAQLKQYAYLLVGQSMLQLEQPQQARLAFEQAARVEGGSKDAQEAAAYNVCAVAYSTKTSLFGDEILVLENFLNDYPTSPYAERVSAFLADIYGTTRNYASALQSIEKIKHPGHSILKAKQRIYYQLGVQHYLNGDFAEAERQFDLSIRMGDIDPVIWSESLFWRGESRFHLTKYVGAIADYKQFIGRKEPGVQADLLAAAWYSLGYAQMMEQNFAAAIDAFGNYIAQPSERGTQGYVDGMLRLADCYYYTRQFQQAESYYRMAGDYESNQLDYALFQEGLMLGLQKRYAEKQTKLDEMITQCGKSDLVDDAWLDKGRTYLLTNEPAQAIGCFQQVLDGFADSPIAPQAAVELAMTYNNMGQTEAAQKVYQLVAERYPDTEAAQTAAEDLHTLGVQQRVASLPALYEQGKYQELLNVFQQLQTENVDFRAVQTMQLLAGKANLALNQQKAAVALLEQAAGELRTASGSEAKFLLAETMFANGDLNGALQAAGELIQSGTPHQYWLARAIILTSDVQRKQGDAFTADEYLKSLQQNYKGQNDDIAAMINARLKG